MLAACCYFELEHAATVGLPLFQLRLRDERRQKSPPLEDGGDLATCDRGRVLSSTWCATRADDLGAVTRCSLLDREEALHALAAEDLSGVDVAF